MITIALTIIISSVTSGGIMQVATGKSIKILSGVVTLTGFTNSSVYVNDALTSDIIAGTSRIVIICDSINCTDVQLGYDGVSYFNGLIGNVQIWDKAFTAEEIAADYANPENVDTSDPHLKGWWPLIEGSSDIAYDWSGNGNHGTLTNFDTATCWEAGKALSNPRVLQTAYMPFNLDAGVLRPIGTSGGVDFNREHNELNWNGRSWVNCGNGPDVNPSSALVIECVFGTNYAGNTKYWVGATKNFKGYVQYGGIKFYVITPDDTQYLGSGYSDVDGSLKHLVIAFSASSQSLIGYENGVLKLTKIYSSNANISPSSSKLTLLEDGLDAQLPLFRMYIDEDAQKIIDHNLDAWVAKRYLKAQTKYGVQ